MQITESLIERIARRVFNAMFPSALRSSGAVISGSGSSVSYAAEAGHASNADNATNASNVPWSGVSGKPDTATRWPSWSEVTSKPTTFPPSSHTHPWGDVTGKPDTATRWPTWSEVTSKPTSKTAWGQTFWDSNGSPATISGDMTSVGNISFSASGKNIGGVLYFDTINNRIGIGVSSPSQAMHVSGNILATGGVTALSDIRKKNIITYKWSPAISAIAAAPIARYTMKDDKDKKERIGSIAQYWRDVMPEAVFEGEDGILSMDYGTISLVSVIALAREVKRLKEEVERLRKN